MLLSIFAILGSYAVQMYEQRNEKTLMPDTIYVVSRYEYLLINDSTMRKVLVSDTIHSKDSTLEAYPIDAVRIIKIEE